MNRLIVLILKFPRILLMSIAVITIVFAFSIMNLTVEADITKAIPSDLPESVYLDRVNELFPKQEFFIIGLISDPLFTVTNIQKLAVLTERFSRIEGAGSVLSPVNLDIITAREDGIEVTQILPDLPETEEEVASFRHEITTNRLYKGTFISPDETAALILIQIKEGEKREAMLQEIKQVIDEVQSDGETYRIAGEGATLSEVKNIITDDLMILSPLVILVILSILFVSFRNIRGVVLPVLTVVISVVWTLGIMSVLNIPLSIMTTVVPTILIAIGSAYGIHIINRFMLVDSHEKDTLIRETIGHTGLAVLMAGLTTIAGFLSFLSSDIGMIREFGIFTAIGVLCALVFSLTFIPALLYVLPLPRHKRTSFRSDESRPGHLGHALASLARAVERHTGLVLLLVILSASVSVAGVTRLRVESDLVQMFGKNSKVMQDNEFFNTYFSGTMTMQVVFESEEADRMKDPEVLTAMQDLQAYAETFEFVGSSQSLADIIEEMHFVMSGNSGEHNLLPESRKLVSQYLLLYSLTGDDKTIENLVNYNYSAANLTLFMKSSNLTKMLNFEKDIEHYIHKNINLNGITSTPTGRITAMSVLSNLIVKSQLLSITVSLLLVLLITSTLLRSFILGMISTIPILITLLVNFGLMGYFDLPLDMATVLIASVAIGIGIDYSIHYITHYISERAKGNPISLSVRHSHQTTGKAIVYNALSVAAGFLVLIFSSLASIGILGMMIALTMAVASFGSLTIIPAILSVLDRRGLLDTRIGKGVPDTLFPLE